MKLTQEESAIVIIIFFVFLGCAYQLVQSSNKEGLPVLKRLFSQFVTWAFVSLLLAGVYIGWGWSKWVCWIAGVPFGIYGARLLRLMFEQAENSSNIIELLENMYNAYKAARSKTDK